MTDFVTLAAAIASQLDGVFAPCHDDRDGAPSGNDIRWINLQNERAGLRVVLRRGADETRLRASMTITADCQAGADYREVPDFHNLTTASAMSRGADVIARQIESKIVQPAVPMLEEWNRKRAARKESIRQHETAIAAFRERFPGASINWRGGYYDSAEFSLWNTATNDSRFVVGEIYQDGTFSVKRMSRLDQSAAFDLIAALTKK